MIKLKKLAFASLFLGFSALAQDTGLKGILLNNASFGVNMGSYSFTSTPSDIGMGFALNYTKNFSSAFGLQGSYVSGMLTDGADEATEMNFTGFALNGILNISNLSVNKGEDCKSVYYVTFGFASLTDDTDSETEYFSPRTGFGMKTNLKNNLDLDLSLVYGTGTIGDYVMPSLGLNYRFMKKEVSAEWNNPLEAMYGDIASVKSDLEGLSTDTDGDGVSDAFDTEENTPRGVAVDGKGNALDVDMDGVADYADEDPFTPRGVQVDANGRELDSDKDGVANSIDIEPNTQAGATVNFQGKEIRGAKGAFMPAIYFDFNSSKVSYANYERLAAVAALLQANPNYKLRVIGYADSFGNSSNNNKVALRRANAVVEALNTMFSIDGSRLTAESKGEDAPLANESMKVTETTADGQVISNSLTRMNRRVEFVIN
jgi:outer membrane protein OmpA-like peptidoglycan-associated protein